ncbi:MAG TPA: FprA family A-type flavoprotein [Methanomassiliicoccales archaeon]|nr:FprA family A-type flavoprotein [Methanomassiliicoccales archaeon]
MHETREITVGVYWVGVRDWDRRLFDALIPLPAGTTYNSYLVTGRERTALIDTVNPGFERELEGKLEQLGSWGKIDYLIMNHAEPDHAGNIPFVLEHNPKAKLVLTAKGAKMATALFHVPEERMMMVKDGDRLDLGGRTLRFIEAPFLHWPETMFTFLEEDKVLFPCDFFGSHHAGGVFSDEVPDLLVYAKKYFGEIMMPFAKNGRNGLGKLEGMEIRMIAPSHGPVHRDPEAIVNAYLSWTQGETVPKVTICYATMWQATKALVDVFAQTLMRSGVEAEVYNLAVSDLASIAGDLVDSRGIVLAGPTVLGGMHPLMLHAANVVKLIKPPAKYAVVLSSYGWGGGAVKQALEVLAPLKLEALGAIDVNGYPTAEDLKRAEELARTMAQRVKEPP